MLSTFTLAPALYTGTCTQHKCCLLPVQRHFVFTGRGACHRLDTHIMLTAAWPAAANVAESHADIITMLECVFKTRHLRAFGTA